MKLFMRKNTNPSVAAVAVKLLLGILFLIFLAAGIVGAIELNWEGDWKSDTARMVAICDEDMHERDYAGLRETLRLWDLYDPAFDRYWEIVDDYDDYLGWVQWSKSGAASLPDSEEIANSYRLRVLYRAANPAFLENAAILQQWADGVQ